MPSLLPESVVIIDPAFVGDTVFSGPLVRSLRTALPRLRLGFVARPPADVLLRRMIGVDEVLAFDKRGRHRGYRGLKSFAKELAARDFAAALIPHPSLRSTLLAHWASIPRRIGNATGFAALFLTEQVVVPPGSSFVGSRLALASALAMEAPQHVSLAGTLEGHSTPAEPDGRLRLGLALGAQWQTKRWPVERALDLIRGLDPRIWRMVWLGSEAERSLYSGLTMLPAARDAIDSAGGGLDRLIDATASCDVVIAGDTGTLHIARALGVPVVGLFGPTAETAHHFTPRDRILSINVACRPCHAHGPQRCPLEHHHCLRGLDASVVLEAIEEIRSMLRKD